MAQGVRRLRSLADAGPGSLAFRAAAEAEGPRTVVFGVAGLITLETPVEINHPFLTLAGQSAPGDGVCVRGQSVHINTHDVVIRYMRFRRGSLVGRDDALGGNPVANVIVDHVSASWGLDENLSLYRWIKGEGPTMRKMPLERVTIQWSISSEALDRFHHAFGATWGGWPSSFHHNLFACNTGRNPSIGMNGLFDFRNNVVFNWVHRTVDGGDGSSRVNLINNYFKAGPATKDEALRHRICKMQGRSPRSDYPGCGLWYVEGNHVEGYPAITADNWAGGVYFAEAGRDKDLVLPKASEVESRSRTPFPAPAVATEPAAIAYERRHGRRRRDPPAEGSGRRARHRLGAQRQDGIRRRDHRQPGGRRRLARSIAPRRPPRIATRDGMPDAWEQLERPRPGESRRRHLRRRPRRLYGDRGVSERHRSVGIPGLHEAGEQPQHAPRRVADPEARQVILAPRCPHVRAIAAVAILAGATASMASGPAPPQYVVLDKAGRLTYTADARGDRVPDFSHAGYGGGGAVIPDVPARAEVSPGPGDAGARVQAAIDHVSGLPADARGFRGAVLLRAGRYEVAGSLRVSASGVVLRGQGRGPGGTVLVATGTGRRPLIRVEGTGRRRLDPRDPLRVVERYVPVGSYRVRLDRSGGLQKGDTIVVTRPGTAAWIAALGMDRFPLGYEGSLNWRPGAMTVRADRVVMAVDGPVVTLDAPLTTSLDADLGGGTVQGYSWEGRIERVGVEDLRCESAYDASNPRDEQHAWDAVRLDAVQDAWVRRVTAAHFAGSAVRVLDGAKWITVQDCTSVEPVSEVGGYRRHAFFTSGQMTLFLRCRSRQGRHDFAVGALAPGPNAFVECAATEALGFSGPVESWASGVLYDNVTVDGGGLALTNRESDGQGVGWAAANCVLWQCSASVVTCRRPPGAHNWAIGCWGQFFGDGEWQAPNEFVKPDSLYRAQLAERLGPRGVEALKPRDVADRGDDPVRSASVDVAAPRPHEPIGQAAGPAATAGSPSMGRSWPAGGSAPPGGGGASCRPASASLARG